MKRLLPVLVFGFLLLWSSGASALDVTGGPHHFAFTDAAALYSGAGPAALGAPITSLLAVAALLPGCPPACTVFLTSDGTPGGVPLAAAPTLRSAAIDTSGQSHVGHGINLTLFNPALEQLTSVIYDLRAFHVAVVGADVSTTTIEVGFVPAGFFPFVDTIAGAPGSAAPAGSGGHLDLYLQTPLGAASLYSDLPGSSAFIPGGATAVGGKHTAAVAAGDAYPAINTAADPDALVMEAVFAPLPLGTFCTACVPGTEVLVSTIRFVTATGAVVPIGSRGVAFLNAIGGSAGAKVITGGIPADVLAGIALGLTPAGAAALGYDISIEIGFTAPSAVSAGATGWLAGSNDPLHFSAVPQPGAVLLLGAGLVSLMALGGWVSRSRSSRKS